MAWMKRITNEYKVLKKDSNQFSLEPIGASMSEWSAILQGPKDTPYENGEFKMKITIPQMYPFSPPKVTCITPIYHPNIDTSGNICVDILKNSWSASLTLEKVMLSISSLLNEPNPDDPLRSDVARLYKKDRKKYNETAILHTQKYAVTQF